MTIARRQLLGFLAAGAAATALAGCGGGSDYVAPTRFVWVLNLNPAFARADVSYNGTVVVPNLPFQAMTSRIEVEYGVYTVGLRDTATGRTLNFDGIPVDDLSASISVFYGHGTSARLAPLAAGIVNDYDSTEALVVELDDGFGFVQQNVLSFEESVAQASTSVNCRMRLRRASDNVLVYDSGLRQRTGAIVIYPADPATGLVGVAGVNLGVTNATAVIWPNIL